MNNGTLLTLTVVFLFVLLILLPMIPMLKSIYKKEDIDPLYMDLDYIFNPRFQVENFEKALYAEDKKFIKIAIEQELNSASVPTNISQQLLFSSIEKISLNGKIGANAILHSKEDIVTQKDSEIFALKSDTSITVGENSTVYSWIDAAKSVIIEKDAKINLVTAKSVKLYEGARFKRIYADTIGIYPLNKGDENKDGFDVIHDKTHQHLEDQVLYFEKDNIIKKGTNINSDIVCRGDLLIEKDCKILGSIKTNGTLKVESDSYVYGNVFSDEKIIIKDNCFVFGNIFSHTYIEIGKNGQIGRYDLPKSLIGIKGIKIAAGTFLHNYILTYGEGQIV
ncbi:MAG: polymer-forming cytoskeletal protein [Sulfurovum sp.]|nr:polymer-forming cytoskeletal protein [Sulfurovum sp.]MBT8349578.1 polymer-forming cytoskeletal protein [Sulfurovum sp.]NNJ46158.1 polymer-forming cytoskeletal protein [Sulfurovum sp.]